MTTETVNKKQNAILKNLLVELKDIKKHLRKFLFLIPEESIKDYKNSNEIKKFYLRTARKFSAK